MSGDRKALIVGPAWVGDMVMAQSLFKLLAQREPGIAIDVLAPSWSGPLLGRMREVRQAISLPVAHGELALGKRFRAGHALRSEAYDRAIVLPRSWKSALPAFFSGARRRTGFSGEFRYGLLNDIRRLDRERLNQTVKRFLALGIGENETLPEPPLPSLDTDPENLERLRAELGLGDRIEGEHAPIVMMPGAAFGEAKCWPLEYYGELAAKIGRSGRVVWVIGSAKEAPAGELIRRAGGAAVRNLCGQTRLEDSIDLLAAGRVAVTNDSGLMHVAAAVGTHVIALYGSTSPSFTPPLTKRRAILCLDLDCSPCFQRTCPLGHLRCLREITVGEVLSAVHAVA